jgi:hypothetical protein
MSFRFVEKQQVNNTFLVKMKKTATPTFNFYVRHMEKTAYEELVYFNGTGGVQNEERMWKMTNGLAVR